MGQDEIPTQRSRASVKVGATALLAFALYVLTSALGFSERAYQFAWGAHELFQRQIPIAALVGAVAFLLVIFLAYALYWDHVFEWAQAVGDWVLKVLGSGRTTYFLLGGQAILAVVVIFAVTRPVSGPEKKTETNVANKGDKDRVRAFPRIQQPVDERNRPEQMPPVRDAAHIARDICDLSLAFDSEELMACEQYLRKHPPKKGTGGEIYVSRKINGRQVIEPLVIRRPPFPKPRPLFEDMKEATE